MLGLFKRRTAPAEETRSASAAGYTAEVMAARNAWITGQRGVAELTATVQACVGLWEGGLSLADVEGTDLLDRRTLATMARALALRGESLFLIRDDGLAPAHEWDVTTRSGRPAAYRLTLADTGGGRSRTALAGEVLHVRLASDPAMPWAGTSPLRRAALTADLLATVETVLGEVYANAPLGSSVVPMPEMPDTDMGALARGFRGMRGRVMIRESVNVAAAGGPMPIQDWKPHDTTPDLSKAMTRETLTAARDAVALAYGVLPALANPATTGPMVREAQRHLAQWQLQPIAAIIAEEAGDKLGGSVSLDVMRPLQAFDAGGRARAVKAIVEALAAAKLAGVDPAQAMKLADWEGAA